MSIKLNVPQEKYAQEVVRNGGDKVAAYKASGWTWKNFTSNTLSVESDKKFHHPKISLRIAELQAVKDNLAEKEFKIDSGFVLRRLKEIDELDIIDIIKDDMSGFKLLSEWPKIWRTSISSLDMKRIVTKIDNGSDIETLIDKIKWPDKVKNLEMIGKHVSVKAWDKEIEVKLPDRMIMPMPSADSVEGWEKTAKEQQDLMLNGN